MLIGGGGYSSTSLFGDASTMYGDSHGGNDTLIGGASRQHHLGDAGSMHGQRPRRHDTLIGGRQFGNVLGEGNAGMTTAAVAMTR